MLCLSRYNRVLLDRPAGGKVFGEVQASRIEMNTNHHQLNIQKHTARSRRGKESNNLRNPPHAGLGQQTCVVWAPRILDSQSENKIVRNQGETEI